MKSISSIAANRLLKKEKANAYYSHFPFIEAFSKFGLRNKISYSTFYKYMSDKFKKPKGK